MGQDIQVNFGQEDKPKRFAEDNKQKHAINKPKERAARAKQKQKTIKNLFKSSRDGLGVVFIYLSTKVLAATIGVTTGREQKRTLYKIQMKNI